MFGPRVIRARPADASRWRFHGDLNAAISTETKEPRTITARGSLFERTELALAEQITRDDLAMHRGVAEIRFPSQRAPMVQVHVVLPREADAAVNLDGFGS